MRVSKKSPLRRPQRGDTRLERRDWGSARLSQPVHLRRLRAPAVGNRASLVTACGQGPSITQGTIGWWHQANKDERRPDQPKVDGAGRTWTWNCDSGACVDAETMKSAGERQGRDRARGRKKQSGLRRASGPFQRRAGSSSSSRGTLHGGIAIGIWDGMR